MTNAYPPGYPQQMHYRNSTPSTMGMLSIIFGALVAAISGFGLAAGRQVGMMMQPSGAQKEMFERYLAEVHTVSSLQSAVFLFMSLALIYIGVGQRKYMRWAVGATIKWSIAGLVFLCVNLVMQLAVLGPALDRLLDEVSHGNPALPMGGIAKLGAFIGLAMYAAYPIVLLSVFRKPTTVAAMDQPAMPTATVVQS